MQKNLLENGKKGGSCSLMLLIQAKSGFKNGSV